MRAIWLEQFAATPGPGSYNPVKTGSGRSKLAATAAFKSSSERQASYLREMGDPGSYKVFNNTVASNSSRSGSFSKSQRAGAGGFGSVSERAEWGGPGRLGPGPLADGECRPSWIHDRQRNGVKSPRLSSGFATKSKRSDSKFGGMLNKAALYTPTFIYSPELSHQKLEKKAQNSGCVLRSKVPRFLSASTITSTIDHAPNNHTLARASQERLRDFRHQTVTREDLFRPPRVRVGTSRDMGFLSSSMASSRASSVQSVRV